MRLGTKERAILSAIQFRSDAPVKDLCKETRLPEHTIRYYINRFREDQLIRPALFTNIYALGYSQYEIYFSLAAVHRQPKQRLFKLLQETDRVVWLAELGGRYQYALTICARNVHELTDFIDELALKYGKIFQEKQFAAVSGFYLFRKKYLTPRKLPLDVLSFGKSEQQVELDDIDRRILGTLYKPGAENGYAVSRATGIPRTTVEFRLKKMRQSGFIKPHIYTMSVQKLGMQVYKILVSVKGLPGGIKEKILQFCRHHPQIVNLLCCLGGWDYEITVEVETAEDTVEVVQSFSAEFGSFISRIEILPVFRHTLARNFLPL